MKRIPLQRIGWTWLFIPVLFLSGLCIWLAVTRWLPLPPTSITIASAQAHGSYSNKLLAFRNLLGLNDIEVREVVVPDEAAPMQLLLDPAKRIDAGFVAGLTAPSLHQGIESLATIERLPVWIFTNRSGIQYFSELKGAKIATDISPSMAWFAGQQLALHAQFHRGDIQWLPMPLKQSVAQLQSGEIDALIMVAHPQFEVVQRLSRNPALQLISIEQVDVLHLQEPRLRSFSIPRGGLELLGDIPKRNLVTVDTRMNLVVKEAMHPALQRLLLDATHQVYEIPSYLMRYGEFPDRVDVDLMPSDVAKAYGNGRRPWLENLLPYWWAQMAELIIYAIFPIIFITVLLLLWIPNLMQGKFNAMLQDFYGQLKFIETDIDTTLSDRPLEAKNVMQNLDDIEAQIVHLDIPHRYLARWFTLREHLAATRSKLLNQRGR
jgi:TRAP-type uncharacterized transport system substrate-binding protein